MLIWTRFGIVVPIIALGILITVQLASDALFGHGFYTAHAIPKLIAGVVGAPVLYFLGAWMNRDAYKSRVLVDPDTGEKVTVSKDGHTFFFLPVEYWGFIFPVIMCLFAFL